MNYYKTFGDVYACGAYGAGNYQTNSCTTAAAGGTAGTDAGGSLLTNTGFDIAVTVTLAAVIMIAAIAVRVFKRKPATENVQN